MRIKDRLKTFKNLSQRDNPNEIRQGYLLALEDVKEMIEETPIYARDVVFVDRLLKELEVG